MSRGTSCDVVVLSPHFDDAVLSLGASIGRWVGAGRAVEVWTAYSSGPAPETVPPRQRAFGDYRVRVAEDDRALGRLGAGHRRLGLRERLWRDPRPRTVLGVFRTPADAAAFGELPALVDVVREVLDRPGVQLYAPLGVGHHVDHVEVALAAMTVAVERDAAGRDAFDRIGFYEDFYALGEGLRRRHCIARRRTWPGSRSPGWAAPLAGLAFRAAAAAPAGAGLDDYLPAITDLPWACRPQPVEGFEPAKFAAIAEYRSQTPKLGGMSRIEALTRRAHRLRGGELVWRVVRD